MSDSTFIKQQQDAVEQMREMNARANGGGRNMPPVPPFVRVPGQGAPQSRANPETEKKSAPPPPPAAQESRADTRGGSLLDIPFINKLKTDGDISLIAGLLLILLSEKADKKLLFALVYIMM